MLVYSSSSSLAWLGTHHPHVHGLGAYSAVPQETVEHLWTWTFVGQEHMALDLVALTEIRTMSLKQMATERVQIK